MSIGLRAQVRRAQACRFAETEHFPFERDNIILRFASATMRLSGRGTIDGVAVLRLPPRF